jgi:hypothetical protein
VVWYVFFQDLEPADVNDGFHAVRIVRVADEKAALTALYDYTKYVGCRSGLFKVSVEVYRGTFSISFHCGQRSIVALHRLSRTPLGYQS